MPASVHTNIHHLQKLKSMKKVSVLLAAAFLSGTCLMAQDSSYNKKPKRTYDSSTNSTDSNRTNRNWNKNKMNKDKRKNPGHDSTGVPATDSLKRNEQ
jgi:hypothetical protein